MENAVFSYGLRHDVNAWNLRYRASKHTGLCGDYLTVWYNVGFIRTNFCNKCVHVVTLSYSVFSKTCTTKFDFRRFLLPRSCNKWAEKQQKTLLVYLDRNYVSRFVCLLVYLGEEKSHYTANRCRKCCLCEINFQLAVFRVRKI